MTDKLRNTKHIRSKIEQLRKDIERHNFLYFNQDNPEISDMEYDILVEKLKNLEPKGIYMTDFMLSYNFDDSDFDHVEVPCEDENDFKVLRFDISRLTIASKDQQNLLQICDDKEAKLKEDTVNLKIKLAES